MMTRSMKVMFYALLIRYGLLNKAKLHIFQDGTSYLRWTLYGIVEKEGDTSPLTEEFKRVCDKFARKRKKSWEKKSFPNLKFEYVVAKKPITLKDIEMEQAAWEKYCQYFWAAFD